ncbi:hypothetical protein CHS0354_042191 [Potamilus streckersoni]|uniref:receptor protein-tyrosine kinase n=2 Tax=Potamilus streckersoni TaxID=2493646 RepID=A0AAE0TNJ2_9BIVA|nr:hypothetical protein CHS0354_042191 [Potamilus streckersoni]
MDKFVFYLLVFTSTPHTVSSMTRSDCPLGYFGTTCNKTCPSMCVSGCDLQTGDCMGGCLPGWQGRNCSEKCSDYRYGKDCQITCGHCKDDQLCDTVSGKCPDGCEAGLQGEKCDMACDLYSFGQDCSQRCGHCRQGKPCNSISGYCVNGCTPGWIGPRCDTVCPIGTYGIDCAFLCCHCSGNQTCHHVTGSCLEGCQPGWTGDRCMQVCPTGKYGEQCKENCGNCEGGSCHYVNGTCLNGCAPGWTGSLCSNGCDDYTYGADCSFKCGSCLNKSCDPITGICTQGCQSGWHGIRCTDECKKGFYGVDCKFACGHCKDGAFCDVITGTCPNGCESGWEGKNCSTATVINSGVQNTVETKKPQTKRYLVPVLVVFIVLLVLALSITVIYFLFIRPKRLDLVSRLYRLTTRMEIPEVEPHAYEQVQLGPWDILKSDLILTNEKLGHGQFGQVRKGYVKIIGDHQIPVAVKSLKANSFEKDKTDFMNELFILKKVGKHPNVVCLVGSCCIGGTLYVAMEYAMMGDLRTYLRRSRKSKKNLYVNYKTFCPLPQTVLLKFALDVAWGMAHLAERQIIHRDLAARNILLDENLVAKVADFGLSKNEDMYVKTSHTRVPVRWLALESLFSNTYSTQSDVWSYGILLWEIVTFGGTPYHGMETRQFINMLKQGYRLRRPRYCDGALYAMMLQCWIERPESRPSFADICSRLQRMLEDSQIYMNIHSEEQPQYAEIDQEK